MDFELKDFQKDVIEQSYNFPVLVDFWAEWCAPCRLLGPILERLAQKNNQNWKLVKVNTEKFPDLAQAYSVRSIPNVKLFSKGKVINEFVGALPEKSIVDWLKKSIPNKYSEFIDKAKNLLALGRNEDAKVILEEIYKEDTNNSDVKVLLAKIFLFENQNEAKKLLDSADISNEYDELVEAIYTIIELLEKSNNPDNLEENFVKHIYLQALDHLKNKNFQLALEKFIEVIRENKYYDDEGARKACIAIFKYLGEDHQITLQYRKEFGRALYI